MQKKFEELQNNFVEMKTKWEMDINTTKINFSSGSNISKKDIDSLIDTNIISKNLKKILQQESPRQKQNVYKKLCNRNTTDTKTILNKVHLSGLQRDDRRRKCMSMVDMDIWRRRCPTSRSTYCLWHRSNIKNRAGILLNYNQNKNESYQNTSEADKRGKKDSDFVHHSIIKQRTSRIFPLTCLDLERKRKAHIYSDIPTKLFKADESYSMNALDVINTYLPASRKPKIAENENRDNGRNLLSYLESRSTKRKMEDIDNV